ncbi:hypothetical protein, partial [Nonomuraea sp. NPDC049709]|uniref:hypothetical protein n=1 Tax=Nonomuraea sp. NPDC049709 TaxID=3154736 RepID=UPI00343DC953
GYGVDTQNPCRSGAPFLMFQAEPAPSVEYPRIAASVDQWKMWTVLFESCSALASVYAKAKPLVSPWTG